MSGFFFPETYARFRPINDWIGATTPLYVAALTARAAGFRSSWVVAQVAWMVGLQLGSAVVMIGLAVWQLRPAFRRHEATPPRRKWFEGAMARKSQKVRPPRWYDRPDCGDDAMGWKERYFARTDVFTKMVVLPATVVVTVFLVLVVGIDESLVHAVSDVWHQGLRGLGERRRAGGTPPDLLGLVRGDLVTGGSPAPRPRASPSSARRTPGSA